MKTKKSQATATQPLGSFPPFPQGAKSISISAILRAQRCPRLYYWTNVAEIEPAGQVPHYFVLGSALHYLVESTIQDGAPDEGVLTAWCSKLMAYEKQGLKDVQTLRKFVEPVDVWVAAHDVKAIEIEHKLDIPPVFAIGDLYVECDGQKGVIDIKSTSDDPDVELFSIDQQLAEQVWLHEASKRELDFSGFLFLNKRDYSVNLYRMNPDSDFVAAVRRTHEAAATHLLEKTEAFNAKGGLDDCFPRYGGISGACKKGPFSTCEYLQLCAMNNSAVRAHMIKNLYKRRERNR